MAEKNIQIKHFNGETWDDLFPRTKAVLTELNDGRTVEVVISELVTNLTSKVTMQEVDAEIEKVVGAAPEALDTLIELAEALGNDPNFAATITNSLSNKVEKVSGKQLSTNDFTNTLKSKVDSLKDHSPEITALQNEKSDKTNTYTKNEVDTRISNLQENAIPVSDSEPTGASIWFEEI